MSRKSESKTKKSSTKVETNGSVAAVNSVKTPAAALQPSTVLAPTPAVVATAPVAVAQPTTGVAPAPLATTQAAVVVRESPARMITRQHIAQRAYELFRAREGRNGSALGDWLQAERELGQL